jgi:hypothetical protein
MEEAHDRDGVPAPANTIAYPKGGGHLWVYSTGPSPRGELQLGDLAELDPKKPPR